ncbi:MAG: L-lactate permease [Thermofilum sp.]
MNASALHGVAVLLLPVLVIAVLKRDAAQASVVTLTYALLAFTSSRGLAGVVDALRSGLTTGLQISSIILSAIYFYNVQRELGTEDKLKASMGSAAGSALYLAVFFSGFVESFSGYGVSPAVAAPLLLSTGLPPLSATASALVGHTWAVPFASVGVPTAVLAGLAEVDVGALAELTAVFASFSLAAIVFRVGRGYISCSYKELVPALLLSLSLVLLAPFTRIYSAAVMGFLGVAAGLLLASGAHKVAEALSVLKYYLLLVAMLLLANLAGFGGLQYTFVVILAAALLSQLIERKLAREAPRRTVAMTFRSVVAVVLFAIVAEIVKRGGYMKSLAILLAQSTGTLYALFVPVVGALGAYATGSATTSNLIFSALQKSYAEAVQVNTYALLALQNVGGGLGGMVSPAKISVAASTTSGKELEQQLFREGWKSLIVAVAPQVIIAGWILPQR